MPNSQSPCEGLVARVGNYHFVEGRFAWFAGHLLFKPDDPRDAKQFWGSPSEFIHEFPVCQLERGYHDPYNPFVVDSALMITNPVEGDSTFPDKFTGYHVVIGMIPLAIGIVSRDEHTKRLAQVVLNAFKDNFAIPSAPIDQENDERETRLPVV